MPISTSLRKLLCCAPVRQEEETNEMPPRRLLPEHPQPQHPPIHFTTDPESGRPIPDENALLRGDYVYVPESGSRITREEFIPPWRNPGVFPTEHDLMSRGWDACYSLHGEGAGMRLMYHWLSGLPGEPEIGKFRTTIN